MKKLLTILLLFAVICSQAQDSLLKKFIKPNNGDGSIYNGIQTLRILALARDTFPAPDGSIAFKNHKLYLRDSTWKENTGAGGTGTVNVRRSIDTTSGFVQLKNDSSIAIPDQRLVYTIEPLTGLRHYAIPKADSADIYGIVDSSRTFDNITQLKASQLYSKNLRHAFTIGYTNKNDGGASEYAFNPSSTATEDGQFVHKPTAISSGSPGRWEKVIKGRIRAAEVGIKSDGTDQSTSLSALTSLSTAKEIIIDGGPVTINSTVNFHGKKLIVQNGAYLTGSGTIDSTILECDYLQQAFDTTLTVTNLINSIRSVKWFGAVADYKEDGTSGTYTNNLTAFTKCYNAGVDLQLSDPRFQMFKDLYVPAARRKGYGYYLGGTWLWNAEGTVFGDGASSTKLFFPNGLGAPAIDIAPPLTTGAGFGGTLLRKGGQNQVFHDLSFWGAPNNSNIGAGNYFDNKSHGINVNSNNVLGYNFDVERFLGDGVHVFADVQVIPATNANNCTFRSFVSNMNGGSGISFRGGDGNNNEVSDFNCSKNGRWGLADYSFLANKADKPHLADNSYENQWQKTNVYNSGHRYRATKSVVKSVSNNGFRYSCKLEHDRTTANSEPGVGSAWHTYWDSVGVGGANDVYNDYADEGNWYYIVNAVVPGVTTGWENYWEEWGAIGSADVFSPQYDSTHWYTEGGGYLQHGLNGRGGVNIGYTEGDQHEITNRGLSLIIGGFAAQDGKVHGGIGYDNVSLAIQSLGWKAKNFTTGYSAIITGNLSNSGYPFIGFKGTYYNLGFDYNNGAWQSNWASNNSAGAIKFISPEYTDKADLGLDTIPVAYGVAAVFDKLHLSQVGGSGHRLFGLTSSTTAPTTGDYGVGSVLLYNGTDTSLLMFRCTTASVNGDGGTWLRINKGGGAAPTGTAGRIALFDPTTGALTDNSNLAWTTTKTTLGTDTVKVSNLQINKAFDLPTTSYANSLGSGNRTATITATTNLSVSGTWTNMINGVKQPETGTFLNGSSCVGAFMTFDFGSGQSKVITELTWYQSAGAYSHGTWKGQGSDDGVTYTDISSNQTLGGAAVTTFSLSPTKGYRYYRLAGVSGNTNGNPWIEEIEFKINDASAGIAYSKIQSTGIIKAQPDSLAFEVPTASYGDSSKNAANTAWVTHKTDSIANLVIGATFNGIIGGTTYSSTGITLAGSVQYVFNGSSPATFTLPSLAANGARIYLIKNAGTSSATLTISRAGSDELWTTTNVSSFTISAGGSAVVAGSGFYWYVHGGNSASVQTLSSQYADASNVSTGETDLLSYTLPANTLVSDGDRIVIEAMFTTPSNGDSKDLKFYFGASSQDYTSSTIATGATIKSRITIIRTGSNTQRIIREFDTGFTTIPGYTTAGVTDTSTIVIKYTGTCAASTDITQRMMTVTYYHAP
jgi:hypothetical protein